MADINELYNLWGKLKTQQNVDPNTQPISSEDLYNAGVHIPIGDPRMKAGLTYNNLSPQEKRALDLYKQR